MPSLLPVDRLAPEAGESDYRRPPIHRQERPLAGSSHGVEDATLKGGGHRSSLCDAFKSSSYEFAFSPMQTELESSMQERNTPDETDVDHTTTEEKEAMNTLTRTESFTN